MKRIIIPVFIAAVACWTGILRANVIQQRSERIITEVFGSEVLFSYEKIMIPDSVRNKIEQSTGQPFYQSTIICWRICREDSTLGFALLDNVPGKALPITFLIVTDANGRIKKCAVIAYREAYGGAVGSSAWLDQFIGRDSRSGFTVGSQIDAISGATISVHALTHGIRKLTMLCETFIITRADACYARIE